LSAAFIKSAFIFIIKIDLSSYGYKGNIFFSKCVFQNQFCFGRASTYSQQLNLKYQGGASYKKTPHPRFWECGDGQCIMVAHAVYREYMASLAGTTSEDSPGSSVAIAGHAARRMTAEGAAGSSG
jgi:hypothetical protein